MSRTQPVTPQSVEPPFPVVRAAIIWCLLVAPLAWWGLPSSADDALLFAGEPPWTAERYELARTFEKRRARAAGADTDLNPLENRDRLIDLTGDEAGRAEILRRYRFFTRQPDEMITLMALQRMNPRRLDFDPRLYQYGGAWIYAVAAAEAAAAGVGYVRLADADTLAERPEWIARYYVVARLLSLAAGALLLAGVARLGEALGGRLAGVSAMLLTALSPLVIAGAVEAKPHLASAAAAVWATWFALGGIRTEAARRSVSSAWDRNMVGLGVCCGLSLALVLTGATVAALWPAILLASRNRDRWGRPLLQAGAIAAIVYMVTNPYLLLNLAWGNTAITSNLDNSIAMYRVGEIGAGVARVLTLMAGNGWLFVIAAGVGAVGLLIGRWREALVLLAPGGALLVLLAAIAAEKPAEFARFLVLPTATGAVLIGMAVAAIGRRRPGWGALSLLAIGVSIPLAPTVSALAIDAFSESEPRRVAARWLLTHAGAEDRIGVVQEPAPFCIPPIDFARRRVLLLPKERPAELVHDELPEWLVLTADDFEAAQGWWSEHYIGVLHSGHAGFEGLATWASKRVFVFMRTERRNPS